MTISYVKKKKIINSYKNVNRIYYFKPDLFLSNGFIYIILTRIIYIFKLNLFIYVNRIYLY